MPTTSILVAGLMLTAVLLTPAALARDLPGTEPPHCLQIYQRYDLGPISIVMNGCRGGVEFNGLSCEDWKPAAC